MNKIHRTIWSAVHQTWVVASEISRSHSKSASTRKGIVGGIATALISAVSLPAYAAVPAPDALPTGGQVVSGQASIAQSGSQMNINQTTNQTILNWNTFNIGANAAVTFQQPSSSAVALNRVIGADPSAIYGRLSANGQVFLINPNGVLFAPGAHVDVGGLVASTLNISNADFLAGNNRFTRDGATGSVVNQGELIGKYVALLAPEVRNEGVIVAHTGTVALAAGEAVTLSITGNNLIDVQVDKASINTLVENKYLIQADAGTVIMSAQSANQLLGQVVNSGTVEANGITADGGVIRLRASSTITNTGNLSADAAANGNGGSIIAIADLTNSNSLTTVDGTLSAKGGSSSGDGGFIETSGTHLKIADTARIDTRAASGKTGQWLLDPDDFTIGTDITGAALGTLLNSNNVTIQTTAGASSYDDGAGNTGNGAVGTGQGDIIVNDSVSWTGNSSLTLDAYRDIQINSAMSYDFMGGATLQINYGNGAASGKAVIAAGVDWTGAGNIVDLAHASTVTSVGVDTSNPYYIGTVNVPIYVRLLTGSGVYGDTNLPVGYFDGAGGARINIKAPTGTVVWNNDPATFTVAGGTYSQTYASGLSSSVYSSFAAGNAANWTVTARPITLTANNQSKTEGTALNLGSSAFTLSSGTMAFSETITGVTLGSVSGNDLSTGAIAGTYAGDITITPGSAVGGGGFNVANYNIFYQNGTLTILPETDQRYKDATRGATECVSGDAKCNGIVQGGGQDKKEKKEIIKGLDDIYACDGQMSAESCVPADKLEDEKPEFSFGTLSYRWQVDGPDGQKTTGWDSVFSQEAKNNISSESEARRQRNADKEFERRRKIELLKNIQHEKQQRAAGH